MNRGTTVEPATSRPPREGRFPSADLTDALPANSESSPYRKSCFQREAPDHQFQQEHYAGRPKTGVCKAWLKSSWFTAKFPTWPRPTKPWRARSTVSPSPFSPSEGASKSVERAHPKQNRSALVRLRWEWAHHCHRRVAIRTRSPRNQVPFCATGGISSSEGAWRTGPSSIVIGPIVSESGGACARNHRRRMRSMFHTSTDQQNPLDRTPVVLKIELGCQFPIVGVRATQADNSLGAK